MSDAWIGFFGGILTTLASGLIASLIQRHNESRKRKKEAQLSAYLHLLELNQSYFWVATAELHGEQPKEEVLTACRKISWKLADELRTFDAVEHLDEILIILFSSSIPTANERARRLDQLIAKYGELVNPAYSHSIQHISNENVLAQGYDKPTSNNAPGAWR